MINPQAILDELVVILKDIPELAGIPIEGYDFESSIYETEEQAVSNMSLGDTAIVVFYEGGSWPREGGQTGIRHDFILRLKARNLTAFFDLIEKIMNGVPATSGCGFSFPEMELTGCTPLYDFEHRKAADGNGIEYWLIRFATNER